jgi:hypothetical protein
LQVFGFTKASAIRRPRRIMRKLDRSCAMGRILTVGSVQLLLLFAMSELASAQGTLNCSASFTKPHSFACVTDTKEFRANGGSYDTGPLQYNLGPYKPALQLRPNTAKSYYYGRNTFNIKATQRNKHQITCDWSVAGSSRLSGHGGYVHGYCYVLATEAPLPSWLRFRLSFR